MIRLVQIVVSLLIGITAVACTASEAGNGSFPPGSSSSEKPKEVSVVVDTAVGDEAINTFNTYIITADDASGSNNRDLTMITGHNSFLNDHISAADFMFDISSNTNVDTIQLTWDDAPSSGNVSVRVINLSGGGPGSVLMNQTDVDTYTLSNLGSYRSGSDALQIKITLAPFDGSARLVSANVEDN